MKEYIEKITNNYFKNITYENNTNRMGLVVLYILFGISAFILFVGGFLNHGERTEVFIICLIPILILLPAINFSQLTFILYLKKDEKSRKSIYVYYTIVLSFFVITTIIFMFIYPNNIKMIVLYWIWISVILVDLILDVSGFNRKNHEIYVKIAVWPMFLFWVVFFHLDKEKSAVKDIIRYITISMLTATIQFICCFVIINVSRGELMWWKICVILTVVSGFVSYYFIYRAFEKRSSFSISGWKYLQFYMFGMDIIYLLFKIVFINSFENVKDTEEFLNISANEFLLPTVTAVVLFFEIFLKQKLENKDV